MEEIFSTWLILKITLGLKLTNADILKKVLTIFRVFFDAAPYRLVNIINFSKLRYLLNFWNREISVKTLIVNIWVTVA